MISRGNAATIQHPSPERRRQKVQLPSCPLRLEINIASTLAGERLAGAGWQQH